MRPNDMPRPFLPDHSMPAFDNEKTKMNETTRNLLIEAEHEITRLRRANELLGAKVETMEVMAAMLFGKPGGKEMGAAPDLVWQIQKHLRETA